MSTNPNDMAFPVSHPIDAPPNRHPSMQLGLTKREYFAAMAWQRLIDPTDHHKDAQRWTAEMAVKYADALIAELAKVKP